MNLEEFKHVNKSVTASARSLAATDNLGGFIEELRSRDQREHRRLLGMAVVFLSLGVVFAGGGMGGGSGSLVTGVGFMLVAVYAGLKGRRIGRVNYAAPARAFLASAVKRYQFWRAWDLLYVAPLFLIMVVGGGLTVWGIAQKYVSPLHTRQILLVMGGYVLFIAAVSLFGLIQGRKLWREKSAAFLEEIRRRQSELDNG